MRKMRMKKEKTKSNTGAILLSSLWILIILTLMAAGISFRSRLMIRLTQNYLNETRHYQLALSGYYQALIVLGEDETKNYDALTDPWANNSEAFSEVSVEKTGKYSIYYQQSTKETVYGILDEERKININTAPEEVLLNLPGFTEELVASLSDWIDPDNNELSDGAEDDYYQDNDMPYHCKNDSLDYLEELLMVRGFTYSIIDQIRDLVTVYGTGAVNINTATRVVLLLLGLDESLVEVIVEFRDGDDGIPGTEDDRIFTNNKEIPRTLSEYEPIFPDELAQLQNLISTNLIDIKSTVFTITSHGYTNSPAESTIISVTVELTEDTPVIKRWHVE